MARFQIEKGGQKYEVEAPDEASALAALDTPPAERPSTAGDVARSMATGLRRGVVSIPGIPGSIEELGRAGINWAGRRMGREGDTVSPEPVLPSASYYQELEEGVTPRARQELERTAATFRQPVPEPQPFYTPQTRAGRYARTVGEFLPGAVMPTGPGTIAQTLARRVGMNVVAPGVASEAAGEATQGTQYEPYARIAAALTAPYAARAAGRAFTPIPATPRHQSAVDTLDAAGVPMTAGQRTGSRKLQYFESAAADTPFAGPNIPNILESQGDEFMRAALRRTGEMRPDVVATPRVLAEANRRIGAEFDRLATNNSVVFRNPRARTQNATARQLEQRTLQAEAEYNAAVPAPAQRNPFVQELVDDINNFATSSPSMPGSTYQAYRSRLSRMAQDHRSDPQLSRFFAQMRDSLDEAMEAGLSAADRTAWQQARSQYRHLMVLEDAVSGATNLGVATPHQLATASRSGHRRAYAEDRTPYSDLAHAGSEVLPKVPNSGTPARLMAGNLSAMVRGATIGRLVGNPEVQGWLGNQLLARPLNWLGPTGPGRYGRIARSLVLPAQLPDERRPQPHD